MGQKHHKPKEIVAKLRQVEVLISQGCALTDGVQDHFLTILTNGKVTTDGVGPTAICSPISLTSGRRTPPRDSRHLNEAYLPRLSNDLHPPS